MDVDTLGNRNIVVATPEKLDFAIRQAPELLDDVALIVLDEAHMIGPQEREVRYEILVQRLLRRTDASNRRLICLSAILPKGNQLTDFVSWVRQGEPGEAVLSEWRPTRQTFGMISWRSTHARLDFSVDGEAAFVSRYINAVTPTGKRKKLFPNDSQELTLASAWRIVEEGGSALIFCPQRRSVGALAKTVLKLHKQGLLKSLIVDPQDIARAKRVAIEWLSESHPAVQCLEIGVAIHHAGLPKPFLREVERLLRSRKLPVIVSSPTLAQGLNLSASSLLMYSLRRGEDLIRGEEFANIIGRAGRARIDIEGQILYVMFEPADWRVQEWKALVNAARHRQIQSGLAVLIALITQKLASVLNLDDEALNEYLANNTDVWDKAFAQPPKKDEDEVRRTLETQIASLDGAILALIEDHTIDVEMLPAALDAILQESLWVRTLARVSDEVRKVQRLLLNNRAQFIWENSTGVQRRGYFAAGVSLKTGKKLDEVAEQLNELLFLADFAVQEGEKQDAIAKLTEFAELVFQIKPFAPDELLPKWQEVLSLWVSGAPMKKIVEEASEDAIEFIEDDLVYRLVWAAEAVRVRSHAHGDQYADLWTGRAAEALEVGTMYRPAIILLQAGLGSRTAALAALSDQPGDFVDYDGMRLWLKSEAVEDASRSSRWPTKETADLWRQFVANISDDPTEQWTSQQVSRQVIWNANATMPSKGTPVRLVNPIVSPRTDVTSGDHERLGRLHPALPRLPGVMYGIVSGGNSIDVRYFGSGKLA